MDACMLVEFQGTEPHNARDVTIGLNGRSENRLYIWLYKRLYKYKTYIIKT